VPKGIRGRAECAVDGCTNWRFGSEWCNKHYQRWKKYGDPLGSFVRPPRGLCCVEGCDRLQRCKGMCIMHYRRVRSTGSTTRQPRQRRPDCEVPDCGRERGASSTWCSMHETRWRRRGTVELPVRPTVSERFWAKVDKNGPIAHNRPDLGSCWIWTGACFEAGYGMFNVDQRSVGAHRWAFTEVVGPVPPERPHLDHFACDNPPCVNPAHLRPATPAENTLRSQIAPAAVNARKTECKRGHPFGEQNTYVAPNGARQCRVCRAMRDRGYRARRVRRAA
jgi:hypothetical protein